jgi:hypothetical protein
MAFIIGKLTTDSFVIFCEDCGERTENQYFGGGGVLRFEAKCKKCGSASIWKFEAVDWGGLPYKVEKD